METKNRLWLGDACVSTADPICAGAVEYCLVIGAGYPDEFAAVFHRWMGALLAMRDGDTAVAIDVMITRRARRVIWWCRMVSE